MICLEIRSNSQQISSRTLLCCQSIYSWKIVKVTWVFRNAMHINFNKRRWRGLKRSNGCNKFQWRKQYQVCCCWFFSRSNKISLPNTHSSRNHIQSPLKFEINFFSVSSFQHEKDNFLTIFSVNGIGETLVNDWVLLETLLKKNSTEKIYFFNRKCSSFYFLSHPLKFECSSNFFSIIFQRKMFSFEEESTFMENVCKYLLAECREGEMMSLHLPNSSIT